MKVALIGLGEVGRCFAQALHAQGMELILVEREISEAAAALAQRMGIAPHAAVGPWLREAHAVLVCSTGLESRTISIQCSQILQAGALIADFTTADPAHKREAAAAAHERLIQYADVAIMGGISLTHARTPLLVSGDGADRLAALLAPLQGAVRVVQGEAGDAIALKLLRSVFTKGLEALGVEVLVAAQRQGVREQLYEVLADIDSTPLRDFVDMVVRTHVVHAARRAHEVEQAAQQLALLGLPSRVLPGVRERFAATAAQRERRPLPQEQPTLEQALDWLDTPAAP
ncbi:NAD(P)-binding domain-containing protein [Acidovorax sp. MR-S7]|uniref:NAD(P)-binding domain-containing protein n=1 Tax=Acidovorax sp. MR-S7 TaxID=1268622 RepID=UPI00054EE95E|nr:NAD(P)-binding domain-containing protein [Acidovorax sp. MR-S7]